MIVYPINWQEIGEPIQLEKIENTIIQILSEIPCNHLSFSGGIDSSLVLYYLSKIHARVYAYTIGLSEDHPDVKYSRLMAERFDNVICHFYIPLSSEIELERKIVENARGDHIVRLFYNFVANYTDGLIACDTIDEYMCGYYAHQAKPTEATYYKYIRELQELHLKPLDKSSGKIRVYLPYADPRLIPLLSQIPLNEKVDRENRKIIMRQLAKNKIPQEVIDRHKYGFCDALMEKV